MTATKYDCVRRVGRKLGFKEVEETEDWTLFWTDTSVSVDRVNQMKRWQVDKPNAILNYDMQKKYLFIFVKENKSLSRHERDLPQGLSHAKHESHGQTLPERLHILSESVVPTCRVNTTLRMASLFLRTYLVMTVYLIKLCRLGELCPPQEKQNLHLQAGQWLSRQRHLHHKESL